MSHIICTIKNASDNISGVAFKPHAEGIISVEPVDADQAARFASIEGFKLVVSDDKEPADTSDVDQAPVDADQAPAASEPEAAKPAGKKK